LRTYKEKNPKANSLVKQRRLIENP